jgi:hypothetical protein
MGNSPGHNLNLFSPTSEIASIIKLFSIIPQSLSLPILQIWVLGYPITGGRGGLMRRTALMMFTGLTLVCFSGCHFHWWHHKHHNDYETASYDACGCDGAYPASADAGPIALSHVVSSSPVVISGPPAAASPAPAGTKVSTPAK